MSTFDQLYQTPQIPEENWSPQIVAEELRKIHTAMQDRDDESLALYQPRMEQAPFHESQAFIRLMRSGNRGGKTLATLVEDARAVTNQDPFDKYPKTGTLLMLGYGWRHIGTVFYPGLFLPGAFKTIRDKETGRLRVFQPWLPDDKARAKEAEPAPPLIPKRLYDPKDIAWESKGQDQFVRVKLKTGWTILAFASQGDPRQAQGFKIDLAHIDEDIEDNRWKDEILARLADNSGRMVWSATPHAEADALVKLIDMADEAREKHDPQPTVVEFRLGGLENNPYIPADRKQDLAAAWLAEGEDVYRMRMFGDLTTGSTLMYPSFNLAFHGLKPEELEHGIVPDNWCRYLSIDPGHATTAVLFGAVSPDDQTLLLYDELYIHGCDAEKFGEAMKHRVGQQRFRSFIIDMHGGRLRDIGSGRTVVEQYAGALRKRRITSDTTGSEFRPGSDNVQARCAEVRLWLSPGSTGSPRLRVLLDPNGAPTTPNLCREIRNYKKKRDARTGFIDDKPNTRGAVHACQALEYLIAANPKWHPMPPGGALGDRWDRFQKLLAKMRNRPTDRYVDLGPAA